MFPSSEKPERSDGRVDSSGFALQDDCLKRRGGKHRLETARCKLSALLVKIKQRKKKGKCLVFEAIHK